MNTNNRNNNSGNNRRRGRNSSNRGQGGGGGGGNQGNRIDNRARGNAPQMLEKYRKLAHDASLNGDRVQTEYYLQFADHYFRVIADSRVKSDDQRATGQREREQQSNGDDFYDYEEETDSRGRRFDTRRDQEDENEGEAADEAPRAREGEEASAEGDDENPFLRESRPRRPRGRDRERAPRAAGDGQNRDEAREAPSRDSQPRESQNRDSQPRESRVRENPRAESRERVTEAADNGFDAGILPPSIARDDAPAAPKRAPRVRKPRKAEDGDAETLEVVG